MRFGAKTKVEEVSSIDIRKLARDGHLIPGQRITSRWSRAGRVHTTINIDVYEEYLRFKYTRNGVPVDYTVWINYTDTNYGKRRWFECPKCGRRVAKLFRDSGYFICRICADLNYESTGAMGDCGVLQHKIDRIADKLKMEDNFSIPTKPKGMHWRTFYRLRGELSRLTNRMVGTLGNKYNIEL